MIIKLLRSQRSQLVLLKYSPYAYNQSQIVSSTCECLCRYWLQIYVGTKPLGRSVGFGVLCGVDRSCLAITSLTIQYTYTFTAFGRKHSRECFIFIVPVHLSRYNNRHAFPPGPIHLLVVLCTCAKCFVYYPTTRSSSVLSDHVRGRGQHARRRVCGKYPPPPPTQHHHSSAVCLDLRICQTIKIAYNKYRV